MRPIPVPPLASLSQASGLALFLRGECLGRLSSRRKRRRACFSQSWNVPGHTASSARSLGADAGWNADPVSSRGRFCGPCPCIWAPRVQPQSQMLLFPAQDAGSSAPKLPGAQIHRSARQARVLPRSRNRFGVLSGVERIRLYLSTPASQTYRKPVSLVHRSNARRHQSTPFKLA